MDISAKVYFLMSFVSFILFSPIALAAERIDIFDLKNDIRELENFAAEIDSYLAELKENGYVIDAEENIWQEIKRLISGVKTQFDAKNYNAVERMLEQIEDIYDTFEHSLENEVRTSDLKYYVDWLAENQKGIEDYLNDLKFQGYEVTRLKTLWDTAKQLYLYGKAEFERLNYESAQELFSKADVIYGQFDWELNVLLEKSFEDQAIKDIKEMFGWYDTWAKEVEKVLFELETEGYNTNEERGWFDDIKNLHGEAIAVFKEKDYSKVFEISEMLDGEIQRFEELLYKERIDENQIIADLEEYFTWVKEFVDYSKTDLTNPEYLSDWEKYGFKISSIQDALKLIESKYNEARKAFDTKDYDKTWNLLDEISRLIESYNYDYYYSWDVVNQIDDLKTAISEGGESISSFKADLSDAGYLNAWESYGISKGEVESKLAEIESIYNEIKSIVAEGEKLYGEGKRDEAIAKLEQAYSKSDSMWNKMDNYGELYYSREEVQETGGEQFEEGTSEVEQIEEIQEEIEELEEEYEEQEEAQEVQEESQEEIVDEETTEVDESIPTIEEEQPTVVQEGGMK